MGTLPTKFTPKVWAEDGDADDVSSKRAVGFVAELAVIEDINGELQDLEQICNNIIDQLPDTDEIDAIQAASSPSATNRFWTAAETLDVYDFTTYHVQIDDFNNVYANKDAEPQTLYWELIYMAGGLYTLGGPNGKLTMTTDGDTNDYAGLYDPTGTYVESNVSYNPTLRLDNFALTQTTNCRCQIGFYIDANNYILFDFDTGTDGNWHTKTCASGTPTTDQGDTGSVAADTSGHKFEIIVSGDGAQVLFKIDGAIKATHTSNIPSGACGKYIQLTTLENAAKSFSIDLSYLKQDRS